MSDDLRPDFDRHPRAAADQAWERAERIKAKAEQQQEEAQPRPNGAGQNNPTGEAGKEDDQKADDPGLGEWDFGTDDTPSRPAHGC